MSKNLQNKMRAKPFKLNTEIIQIAYNQNTKTNITIKDNTDK